MDGMVHRLKARSARAARRAGLTLVGAILFAAGLGFFTAAAWMVLSVEYSALFAAMVLGAAYTGLGLILFAAAALQGSPPPPQPEERHEPYRGEGARAANLPPIAEAFVFGLNAGMEADRHVRPRA